jgi:hypothetical protein
VVTSDLPEAARPCLKERLITAALHQSPAVQGAAALRCMENLVSRGALYTARDRVVRHRIILSAGPPSDDDSLFDPPAFA